jgi:arylsulfatase A-like enzyme
VSRGDRINGKNRCSWPGPTTSIFSINLRGLGALALAALLTTCGPSAPRTNVLLISIDTLRADRLGCYGNAEWGQTTSPHIDALAAQGAVLDADFTARGQTHPSLSTMITGKYPITTGLRENGLMLLPEHLTLLERLQKAGWRTGAFLANFGLDDPGDGWVFRGADVTGDGYQGHFQQESRQREGHFQTQWDDRVEASALAFLKAQKSDAPFAAWVHFYDVHRPYNPPAGFDLYGQYDGAPEALRAPGPDDGPAVDQHVDEITLSDRPVPDAELRRIRGLYDGAVTEADARVGRLLAALEQAGLAANTLVIVTADHGDELYDHNRYFYHGNSVYDGVVRIPCVVRGPSLPAGRRVAGLAQNVDLVPTVLELLGLPPVKEVEGHSLAALLRGQSEVSPRPFAFIEWQDIVYAVTDGHWKYIHNPQHAHLLKEPFAPPPGKKATRGFALKCFEAYDISTDPHEQHDLLAGKDPATLGRADGLPPELRPLREALDRWLAEPQHERTMSWPGMTQARADKLGALGYASGQGEQRGVLLREPCTGK